MFPIIGTGEILDDGRIATNAHVVDALRKLPRPPNFPTAMAIVDVFRCGC
jgi:hypothetical protein